MCGFLSCSISHVISKLVFLFLICICLLNCSEFIIYVRAHESRFSNCQVRFFSPENCVLCGAPPLFRTCFLWPLSSLWGKDWLGTLVLPPLELTCSLLSLLSTLGVFAPGSCPDVQKTFPDCPGAGFWLLPMQPLLLLPAKFRFPTLFLVTLGSYSFFVLFYYKLCWMSRSCPLSLKALQNDLPVWWTVSFVTATFDLKLRSLFFLISWFCSSMRIFLFPDAIHLNFLLNSFFPAYCAAFPSAVCLQAFVTHLCSCSHSFCGYFVPWKALANRNCRLFIMGLALCTYVPVSIMSHLV